MATINGKERIQWPGRGTSILSEGFSQYLSFNREEWARLRLATPLLLSEDDLKQLQGLNEQLSLAEVSDVYLPLSRLLNLYVSATRYRQEVTHAFLGTLTTRVPYIIGVAGSVAVGKSTTSRILQALMARWPNRPKVDLVTTDGFLYPNRVLEQKGLMKRKGFPESYDVRGLLKFLADVKSGLPEVSVPIYSHLLYDIVPLDKQVIRQPDILIVEGLNVLQTPVNDKVSRASRLFVSDFFNFSIYVHAREQDIRQWYIDRFQVLRRTAFQRPESYFRRYGSLSEQQAEAMAGDIWDEINAVNLIDNIYPTMERAHLILEKGQDHAVLGVKLRKL